MPPELVAWLVLGFLALVVLHELTHVLIARFHGHPTVCVAINPIGVAVVFEDSPRARYWLLQVILPAIVSWVGLLRLAVRPVHLPRLVHRPHQRRRDHRPASLGGHPADRPHQRRRHSERVRRGREAGPRPRPDPSRLRGAPQAAGPCAVHGPRPQALARDLARHEGRRGRSFGHHRLTAESAPGCMLAVDDASSDASRARVRRAAGALRRLFEARPAASSPMSMARSAGSPGTPTPPPSDQSPGGRSPVSAPSSTSSRSSPVGPSSARSGWSAWPRRATLATTDSSGSRTALW